jgi:hypothetical protein
MAVAMRHHASRFRLFGSVARGEERPDSDTDLLVDFGQDSSLFDLMRMILDALASIWEWHHRLLIGRSCIRVGQARKHSGNRQCPASTGGAADAPDRIH